MSTRFVRGLVALFLSCAMLAPAIPAQAAKYTSPKPVLSIGSHASGSMYVVFLAAWAKVLTDNFENLNVSVEAGSPTKNIVFVTNGETDFGMTSDLHSALGMTGEDWANGTKYTDIRSIIPAYSTSLVVWALEGSKVKNFPQDLNGAVIAAGAKGAGADLFVQMLIKVFDLKPKKIAYSNWSDTSSLLSDGLADVGINTGGHPASFIQELEARHDLRIMTASPEDTKKFMEAYGNYYTLTSLDPVYKGMNGKPFTNNIGSCNFVFTSKDMPDDFIYNIVKATWEHADEIRAANPSLFAWMKPENIVNVPVPLHPGAVKYYRELGIEIPERLIAK